MFQRKVQKRLRRTFKIEPNVLATMNKDLVTWNDDLNHAKGSIAQLQAAILQVVKRTPNVQEFNELIQIINRASAGLNDGDKFLIEKLKLLLNTPQLKIGMKFKQLFELEELPFLKMLTLIHLKLNKDGKEWGIKEDQLLNYLLEYHRKEDSDVSVIDADVKELQQLNEQIVDIDAEDGNGFKPADMNQQADINLPDLLPIKDDKLFKRTFLHESFIDPLNEIENLEDIANSDNSKLVILGRMVLRGLLIEILMQKYPKLYHEDMLMMVEQLMNVNILFKLSLVYNLVDNFKFKVSDKVPMSEKLTIIGDIFLSYMGGLSFEYSRIKLKIWVYNIYKFILPPILGNHLKAQTNNPQFIFNQFHFLLSDLPVDVKYEWMDAEPYGVKLYITATDGTDEELGIYMGLSSDETSAKVKAIGEFLHDAAMKTVLTKKYEDYMAKQELKTRAKKFTKLLSSKNIEVSYNQLKLNELYHLTIKIDNLILSTSIDRDETMVKTKGESMAYDNLRVLTE